MGPRAFLPTYFYMLAIPAEWEGGGRMYVWGQVQFRGKLRRTVLARPTGLEKQDEEVHRRSEHAACRQRRRAAASRLSVYRMYVRLTVILSHSTIRYPNLCVVCINRIYLCM